MELKGQDKLLSTKLGQTTLFIGPAGCGKHLFAKQIAKRDDRAFVEISKEVTYNELNDYTFSLTPALYYIDLDNFSINQQNKLLKFIEEPSIYMNVILGTTNETKILPTILNRCTVYRFEKYSKDLLREIIPGKDDSLYDWCETPGQLLRLNANMLNDARKLAIKFLTEFENLTYTRLMGYCVKFNYKDTYSKIDIDTFFKALSEEACNKVLKENDLSANIIFKNIKKACIDLQNKSLNREHYILNLFSDKLAGGLDEVKRIKAAN